MILRGVLKEILVPLLGNLTNEKGKKAETKIFYHLNVNLTALFGQTTA